MRAWRSPAGRQTSLAYILLFVGLGVHLPFWPLWLADWGLSAAEVGSFTAAGVLVRVIAGFALPLIADQIAARRAMVGLLAAIGAATFWWHDSITDRTTLLIATMITGAVYAGMMPLLEALGAAAARTHGFAYAEARSLGSAAFLATSLIVGPLIARYGADIALWWIIVALIGSVLIAPGHPGGGHIAGRSRPRLSDLGRLIPHPPFLWFLGTVALTQASHAVYYAYGSIHWRVLGLMEGEIGALWAFAVAVETALMLFCGAAVIRWLGPVNAMIATSLCGIIRWALMMLDPTGLSLWLLQVLHAGSFALGLLAMIAFIDAAIDDRVSASVQGLASTAIGGILMAGGMALAAEVYPDWGGLTYGLALIMSLIGMICAIALRITWKGGPLGVEHKAPPPRFDP